MEQNPNDLALAIVHMAVTNSRTDERALAIERLQEANAALSKERDSLLDQLGRTAAALNDAQRLAEHRGLKIDELLATPPDAPPLPTIPELSQPG